ncbi:MAG: type I restriction endonuclease subunit R [bacterium]|nr:type I restriction endonuclease subunit R [bacterium]
MTWGPEWEKVEGPLLEHLGMLGWETLVWSERQGTDTVARLSDRDVLLEDRLKGALVKINPGPNDLPWLDDIRIKGAVAELTSMPAGAKLLEANRLSTDLLLRGVTVAGMEGWDGGRDRTIDYIDWDNWKANDFLAVSQFPIATAGRAPNIRPDVTLFVNGIPLVVIEAKPPGTPSGIAEAINQIHRYANQRRTEVPEGAEQLFWTNQFTVATTGERAEVATFTALPEHYMAWKDPFPYSVEDVADSLGKPVEAVTQQELLAAGMLAPQRLLDIVRHFTVFMDIGPGRTVKIVSRYQQYRGVQKAMRRLLTGPTKAEDGETDRRGGIVWHTQGSGKSLTMVFLVRAMRSHPDLRRFKIVLVTDRTALERQLRETAALVGETVYVARRGGDVRRLVGRPGPGVVMVMIQKYRDTSPGGSEGAAGEEMYGTLNPSESILVMVDEAHRSHGSILHANLMAALPNAARIGFTGTPIIMGKRKRTRDIFGGYLDRYTLADSEADGSTVPIFYEGRTTDAAVKGASRMDTVFYRWFAPLTDDQRQTLQRKYATTMQVLQAPELIEAKAKDVLRHYLTTVMPDGFKGMIVATSRKACLRYFDALNKARDELIEEIERGDPYPFDSSGITPSYMSSTENTTSQIELLRSLEFAPVISGDHNDPPHYAPWTAKQRQQIHIDGFKLPLGSANDKHSPLALLIVKSMLLTGFDAPQAQVLYLDRLIQEAELLQAIARVNRTAPKKSYGLVVDYYGVSAQLTQALAAYANADGDIVDPDVDGALRSLTTEIEKLEPQRQRVKQIFVQRGVEPAATNEAIEQCVQLLADERLRAEFDVALRTFFTTFDTVLPRPEALPFVEDVNLFGEIQIRTRRRYRDTPDGDFDPHKYKEKVRRLIDQHITVLDLSQKIQPLKITDPTFNFHVQQMDSERAMASEMEHAIRHHIRTHVDEDPAYYRNLSERIDEILDRLEDRWDQIAFEFKGVIDEIKTGRSDEDDTGLDPSTELPFYGQMVERVASSVSEATERLIELTVELVAQVRRVISVVGFWDNATKQDDLRKAIKRTLDDSDLFPFASLDELSVELVALAKANQHRLS